MPLLLSATHGVALLPPLPFPPPPPTTQRRIQHVPCIHGPGRLPIPASRGCSWCAPRCTAHGHVHSSLLGLALALEEEGAMVLHLNHLGHGQDGRYSLVLAAAAATAAADHHSSGFVLGAPGDRCRLSKPRCRGRLQESLRQPLQGGLVAAAGMQRRVKAHARSRRVAQLLLLGRLRPAAAALPLPFRRRLRQAHGALGQRGRVQLQGGAKQLQGRCRCCAARDGPEARAPVQRTPGVLPRGGGEWRGEEDKAEPSLEVPAGCLVLPWTSQPLHHPRPGWVGIMRERSSRATQ